MVAHSTTDSARETPRESTEPAGSVEITTALGESEWDAFVQSAAGGTVEHLWRWRSVFEEVFRQQAVYVAAKRRGSVVGVLPLVCLRSVLLGRIVTSLPHVSYGGLVTSDAAAAKALVDEATRVAGGFGATHVELRNIEQCLAELPSRQHKVGSRLRLPSSSEALWGGLDRKLRNQVRKAQKSGLTVRRGGPELLDVFYPVFARNMRDLGTPVYPRRLFEHTLSMFGNAASVFVVDHGQYAVAAAMAITWRQTTLVPWASSLREYRHLCANVLLYWSMIENSIEEGSQTFDFGRSTRGGGTHQFKQQWGADDLPLHWEYVLLQGQELPDTAPTSGKFSRMVSLWQRLPVGLANVVGPHLIRHLA